MGVFTGSDHHRPDSLVGGRAGLQHGGPGEEGVLAIPVAGGVEERVRAACTRKRSGVEKRSLRNARGFSPSIEDRK